MWVQEYKKKEYSLLLNTTTSTYVKSIRGTSSAAHGVFNETNKDIKIERTDQEYKVYSI